MLRLFLEHDGEQTAFKVVSIVAKSSTDERQADIGVSTSSITARNAVC